MASAPAATKPSTPWTTYLFYAATAVVAVLAGYGVYSLTYRNVATFANPAEVTPELITAAGVAQLDELRSEKVDQLLKADDFDVNANFTKARTDAETKPVAASGWFWWKTPEVAAKNVTSGDLGFKLNEDQTEEDLYKDDFKLDETQVQDFLKHTNTEVKAVAVAPEYNAEADALLRLQANHDATTNSSLFVRGTTVGAAAATVAAVGAGAYFGKPMVLGEDQPATPVKDTTKDTTKDPKIGKDGKPVVEPKVGKDGKPVITEPQLDADGKPIVDTAQTTPEEETEPKKTDDEDTGIGGWAIFFIILACLAVVGGLVYFFFFMPKDEDEEFDAEAQDEQNEL